jgi:hypothetical protein
MPHSFAERPSLQCPDCGQTIRPKLWLIIDAAERPDLIDRARDGTLHHVTCRKGHRAAVDAPLLIFRRGAARPLIFSPQQQSDAEEDAAAANRLVNRLADSLGDAWQDDWLDSAAYVPRELLAVALSDDPLAAIEEMGEVVPPDVGAALAEMATALAAEGITLETPEDLARALDARPELRERLLAATGGDEDDDAPGDKGQDPLLALLQPWIETPSWTESYRFLLAHPDLLGEPAEAALAGLLQRATAAGNANAMQAFSEHLALLRRSREAGAGAAYAEKLGVTPERFAQAVASTADEAQLPPGAHTVFQEIVAALAAEGVNATSPEEPQAALAARPELRARLEAVLGSGGAR